MKPFFTLGEFAKRNRISRQRAHQLKNAGRIVPEPYFAGSVWLVEPRARIIRLTDRKVVV